MRVSVLLNVLLNLYIGRWVNACWQPSETEKLEPSWLQRHANEWNILVNK